MLAPISPLRYTSCMELSDQLVLWADELRAISSNGLQFVKSAYDETNYQRIRDIAAEMLALVDGRPLSAVKEQLLETLDHYTPMVMGDALVINDAGEMLLIQRVDSGLWAAPGGAFDVGETAAEGAIRECFEETGWRVEPLALIGLYDSRRVGTRVGHHVYHLSFLCRPLSQDQAVPSHAMESLRMGWFSDDALPPLDLGHRIWVPHAFRFWRGETPEVFYDR